VIKISSEEESIFEGELENLLNAFYALMPTSNRISQFLLLAEGQDFEMMRAAYPELLGDKKTRDKFFRIFGYETREGKIIGSYPTDFRYLLNSLITSYLRILSTEEWRNRIIAAILKEAPNPELEWLRFRLQALKEADATAMAILKIWKAVAKETRNYNLEPKEILSALKEHMELNEEQLNDALNLIMIYKLITKGSGDKYAFSDEFKRYEDVLDEIDVE
jgi:hypothetical protein